jgi:pentatricopeptide repeat protein
MVAAVAGGLYFRMLGPLSVERTGEAVCLGGPQQRAVLAALLLRANEIVSVDQLVELLWADSPPPSYRVQLQGLVSNLRRAMADDGSRAASPILTRAPGYRLDLPPEHVDLELFRSEVATARQARGRGDHAVAADVLDGALARWRGPALADVTYPMIQYAAASIDEARLGATEERIDADLAAGRCEELTTELVRLTAEHPLRERFHGQLMSVYARAGRLADALSVYRQLRESLVEELGIEPSAELQRLHRTVLAGGVDAAEGGRGQTGYPVVRPAQLPCDVSTFTGREAELAELLARCAATADAAGPAPVLIISIDGMGGVGKTTFAVHFAHRVSEHFPDGQLFLDLRGFTHGVEPLEPATALDRLLRAVGVPGEQVPVDFDERVALYRSRLAQRRMLVVLDNAESESQVQPLVPPGPGCLLVVNSRRRLAGLDDTYNVSLDVLPVADAVTLFHRVAGEHHLTSEKPALVEEAIELCARLPLAIRIAAARLRSRPTWTLSGLIDRLRDQQRRLAELEVGQRSVAASFQVSYDHLPVEQQHLFRRLGLHPGVDFERHAAAALAGTSPEQAERLLERLLDVHLIQQCRTHRYQFHDLLRSYAFAVATDEDPDQARHAAQTRVLDHYAHTASIAVDVLHPGHSCYREPVPPSGTPIPPIDTPDRAAALLEVELPNLLAAATFAAGHGWPAQAVRFSQILFRHLDVRSNFAEAKLVHTLARDAARILKDPVGEAHALNNLSSVCFRFGRQDMSLDHLRRALALFRRAGNVTGQARALGNLGIVYAYRGPHSQAVHSFQQALALQRQVGNRCGEARSVLNLGTCYLRFGEFAPALDHLEQGMALCDETGNRCERVRGLTSLGELLAKLGRQREALARLREAVRLADALDSPDRKADALRWLGNIFWQQGRHREAHERHQEAIALCRETGDRVAESEILCDLGWGQHLAGQLHQANSYLALALTLAERVNNRLGQARAHERLGHVCRSLGRDSHALAHWRQAMMGYTELGHPDAAEVQKHLQ